MPSTEDTLDYLLALAPVIQESEFIRTHNANGRVLSEDLVSRINVPNVNEAAIDGYAVRQDDIEDDLRPLKIIQRIQTGMFSTPLRKGEAATIVAGAALPEKADTIVPFEDAEYKGKKLTIKKIPLKNNGICNAGEYIRKGDVILEKGTNLKAQHLGLAGSVGYLDLPVIRKLRVAIFSIGDEVVAPGEFLRPGHVYNSNRYLLRALLEDLNCAITDKGNLPDDRMAIIKVLKETVNRHDFILATSDRSLHDNDHAKKALESVGEIKLWQLAMQPSKPLAYAELDRHETCSGGIRKTSFIGLPGNPVSSFTSFMIFARPFILRMQGVDKIHPFPILMRADFSINNTAGKTEYLHVRINGNNGLELFDSRTSGGLTSIVWSDGFITNPAGNTIKKGDMVRFYPLSSVRYT